MDNDPGKPEATIEGAVRLGAALARLPTLPTHDWMDRAAAAVTEIAPDATVITLLGSIGLKTTIERIGAAGPGAGTFDRSAEALMERGLRLPDGDDAFVRPLITEVAVHFEPLVGAVEDRFIASALITAEGERRLTLLVAGGPPSAAPLLRLAAIGLAGRALVALGPLPRTSAQWLLPVDLDLLEGLIAGKTIAEIAATSGRTAHAVQDAIKAMYRRLGRNRRTDLVARAVGHVPSEPLGQIEGKGAAGATTSADQ